MLSVTTVYRSNNIILNEKTQYLLYGGQKKEVPWMVSAVMLGVAHFYGVFCFPLSTTQPEVLVAANRITRWLVAKSRDLG